MAQVDEMIVDGVTYYVSEASDGWPTGPCESSSAALKRVADYESGVEVDEAAPGMVSRRQLTAFLQWASKEKLAPEVCMALEAKAAGLHSASWVRVSAHMVKMDRVIPDYIFDAGGAKIGCSAGEPSLMRGA